MAQKKINELSGGRTEADDGVAVMIGHLSYSAVAVTVTL